MKIVILNGNPNQENQSFDQYLGKLTSLLVAQGHQPVMFQLRDLNIHPCIGCYSCWLKTPGECVFKDDVPSILKKYINSDLVIFATPIVMGFMSSSLKAVQERTHPLALPFLYFKDDRTQHVPRYEKYPAYGVLLEKSSQYDEVSAEIIDKVFRSGKTRNFAFTKTTESNPEEVAYAINNI